jgi:hypothetical protein
MTASSPAPGLLGEQPFDDGRKGPLSQRQAGRNLQTTPGPAGPPSWARHHLDGPGGLLAESRGEGLQRAPGEARGARNRLPPRHIRPVTATAQDGPPTATETTGRGLSIWRTRTTTEPGKTVTNSRPRTGPTATTQGTGRPPPGPRGEKQRHPRRTRPKSQETEDQERATQPPEPVKLSQNARRLPTLDAEGGQCPRARAAQNHRE